MNNQRLISVIMPIYNAERHLKDAIESVLGQTYENIELILVNDGSSDSSGVICKDYAERDGRIRYIEKDNGGVSSARNEGLAIASGDFIGFVDADDRVAKDMYEYMLNAAVGYGADIVQCASYFETKDGVSVIFSPSEDTVIAKEDLQNPDLSLSCFSGGSCCKLFSARVAKELRFDTDLTIGEDMYFNLQALMLAERTALTKDAKYHYLCHSESATNSAPTYERLTSYGRMLDTIDSTPSLPPALSRLIFTERMRNNMHVASSIVTYRIAGCDGLMEKIRFEIKDNKKKITSRDFSRKERFKLWLISRHPRLYKRIIGLKAR